MKDDDIDEEEEDQHWTKRLKITEQQHQQLQLMPGLALLEEFMERTDDCIVVVGRLKETNGKFSSKIFKRSKGDFVELAFILQNIINGFQERYNNQVENISEEDLFN